MKSSQGVLTEVEYELRTVELFQPLHMICLWTLYAIQPRLDSAD